MTLYYAGIGSRETPDFYLKLMVGIAKILARYNIILRSGGADGADTAFEDGCVLGNGPSEIWLPWPSFNGHVDTGYYPTEKHFEYASTIHPAWEKLTRGPRALHARNIGQILGADLATPVSFVLCYTPDGAETFNQVTSKTGGTGTAIKVASKLNIPVFNMYNENYSVRLKEFIKTLTIE